MWVRTALKAASQFYKGKFKLMDVFFPKPPRSAFPGVPVYRSDFNSFEIFYNVQGDPEKVMNARFIPLKSSLERDEVKVKLMMAPINTYDLDMIYGIYFVKPSTPAIAGSEGFAKVVEVGEAVETLRAGDWVIPRDYGWGTWRTLAVAPESSLFRIPNDIPALGAATLAGHPFTAYRILASFVDLEPGDAVILNGANNFLGHAVIQLCKEWGITSVNIIQDSSDNEIQMKALRQLGGDHVVTDRFLLSDDMQFFVTALRVKPKLAIDCLGGRMAVEIPPYMDRDGVMVTYGRLAEETEDETPSEIVKQVRVKGFWESTWNENDATCPPMKEMTLNISEMMRRGVFVPPPCRLFTIDEYQRAIKDAKQRGLKQKIVFAIDGDLPGIDEDSLNLFRREPEN